MRSLTIKYNPYTGKSVFLLDNKRVDNSRSRFHYEGEWANKRLQEWVYGLPGAIEKEIGGAVEIDFYGYRSDCEDIIDTLKSQKNRPNFNCKLQLHEATQLDNIEAKVTTVSQEFLNGVDGELKSNKLSKAIKEMQSNNFFIYVIATMSSGKSTLLNALLKMDLLPSANQATTAKTSWIHDNDDQKEFLGTAYSDDNRILYPEIPVNRGMLSEWNDRDDVSEIKLVGDIPFVDDNTQNLVLVDTPGPNNSRDEKHRLVTQKIINNSPKALVLYILNAKSLGVNDDDSLLRNVAASMEGSKAARDRFIFVLNKMDDYEGDEVQSAVENATSYLEDHGIPNPQIFPVSAKVCLDIRTLLAGKTSLDGYGRKDPKKQAADGAIELVDSEGKKFLNTYASVSHSIQKKVNKRLEEHKQKENEVGEAEIYTGVPTLEYAIEQYVEKYARPAKIRTLVDTFNSELQQSKLESDIKMNISKDAENRKKNREKILELKQKLGNKNLLLSIQNDLEHLDLTVSSMDIRAQGASTLRSLQTSFKRIASKYQTSINSEKDLEKMVNEIKRAIDNVQAEAKSNLDKFIVDSYRESLEQINAKISQLLLKMQGELDLKPLGFNLKGFVLPNVDHLVSNVSDEYSADDFQSHVHDTGARWWKPWTWGESRYKTVAAKHKPSEIVDDIYREYKGAFGVTLAQSLDEGQLKVVNMIKTTYIPEIEANIRRLMAHADELDKMLQSDQRLQERIAESQRRLNWIKDVENQLNAAIEIN